MYIIPNQKQSTNNNKKRKQEKMFVFFFFFCLQTCQVGVGGLRKRNEKEKEGEKEGERKKPLFLFIKERLASIYASICLMNAGVSGSLRWTVVKRRALRRPSVGDCV